jgi:hypothetical protein
MFSRKEWMMEHNFEQSQNNGEPVLRCSRCGVIDASPFRNGACHPTEISCRPDNETVALLLRWSGPSFQDEALSFDAYMKLKRDTEEHLKRIGAWRFS